MLRKLKLYGELAKFVGHKEFEIKVHSLPQAISFLINNFPKVEKYMNPKYYQVKIGNYTICLLYTSPSPRDPSISRMPSSA